MEEGDDEEEEEGGGDCLDGVGDLHRGLVDATTEIELMSTTECFPQGSVASSSSSGISREETIKRFVRIITRDEEMFPVRRKLLRPCITLTSLVQAGKGKYKDAGEEVAIGVDACTFDRVLLYLEHVARGDDFKFDPLIAGELLEAAQTLGIADLVDRCNKVLGSFEVWKTGVSVVYYFYRPYQILQ